MQNQTNTTTQKYKSDKLSPSMKESLEACLACYQSCTQLITHCLQKGGKHAGLKHIRLLQDCAQICQLSADFMIRDSDFKNASCDMCAKICNECAVSCEAFGDDEMMRACAEVCRKCAKSCLEMTQQQ